MTSSEIFALSPEADWDIQLHGVGHTTCVKQAKLPLGLGGCGLRDSVRTSSAAYWASWADALPGLLDRFPAQGRQILFHLSGLQALDTDEHHEGPLCLTAAELAGKECSESGEWNGRPLWIDLAAGLRPPEPTDDGITLGEWRHGWQYHSSNGLEQKAQSQVLRELAWPSLRSNAASAGKARLYSCMGPFASSWMTICPMSDVLRLNNCDFQCAVRRRLGVAASIDGPDAHGHRVLADNTGGSLNARHSGMLAAWRQVFAEAGGHVPDRNCERLLRNTHVPVQPDDCRRLDLVVPGLNVARGLPLSRDATVISPISRNGGRRGGTRNRAGAC